jgi:uncharacterized membrane protein
MAKEQDPKKIAEENKSLKEQIQLLQDRNKLQEESFDISSSSLDSLKELLGIQVRSSTFEKATLKINQDINVSILNQKTGLSSISSIQKQIQKNEDLLKKSKLIESSLEKSIGGDLTAKGKMIAKALSLQKEYVAKLEGSNNLSEEEISLLTLKLSKTDALISNGLKYLSASEKQLIVTRQNSKELENQQTIRKSELNIQKQIEKRLGVVGDITKGLGAIPGIGRSSAEALEEVTAEIQKQVEESGKLPSRWKTFGMIVGKTSKNIFSSLTDPAIIITGLVSIFKDLDSGAGNYAKSMNVSYTSALNTRKEMSNLALSTGDSALNSANLMESQVAVGQALGTNAKLNKDDLVTMTKLTHQAGYTHDELMGVQQLSLVNGKSLKQNTKEILGGAQAYASRNKIVVNEKQILKEVSKASASLKLSLGGGADALARSAVQAKQFGINLEQAEKMSQSLLNFEESIESELSAELLTGKDLNLERARGLALNGDAAAAAAEIANQVGSAADFGKMNVIQQEAIAKAVGMQRDELAQSLIDKESLAKLGAEEGQSAQDRYNELKSQGKSEAEIATQLGDAQLAKQYEQQSIQEKFNDSMNQLKEVLVAGILPAFTVIGTFLTEHMGIVKALVGLMIALKVAQIGWNAGAAIGLMIEKKRKKTAMASAALEVTQGAFKSLSWIPILGAGLAVALAAATIGGLAMYGNDVMSPGGSGGGYGSRTLFGPEGAIQLNNKDTVIAGTNLFDKADDMTSYPKGALSAPTNSSNSSDMKDLKNAMMAMANRPVNVGIDGEKVLKATTGKYSNTYGDEVGKNSYKIQ